jgi:hypothetical protein
MKNALGTVGVVVGSLLAAVAASAGPASDGWRVTNAFAGSVNRLGLQNDLELSWRRGPLAAGVAHVLSPAYTRVHGWAEVTPVRAATLRVGAAPSGYFGTFDSLMGFQSLDDDFGDDARERRASTAGPGTAILLYVQPTLRMAAGPVAAVASASLEQWHARSRGTPVFYEPSRDALVRTGGGRLLSTSAALVVRRPRAQGGELSVGVLHKRTVVPDARGNDAQRAGAFVTRAFGGRRFGLREPRVSVAVLHALQDRYREGQLGAAASLGFRLAP